MERFVDLSLADIGRTVYRYRPVVAAAVAIMILGLALPAPRRLGSDLAQFATGPTALTQAPATQSPAEIIEEVAMIDPGSSAAVVGDTGTTFSGSTSFPSSSSSVGARVGSGPSDSGSSPSSGSASSEPSRSASPPAPEPAATSSATTSSARPAIVTTLYASRTAGTPLATQGVPSKSLPVGKLGQEDKVSFIRFSKAPDTLVLKANPAGDRNAATAVIQVCLVKTVGWTGGEAVAFAAAPERDCTVSVLGVRATDGLWSFDLRPLEGRGGDGISLAPAATSPADFQVAFEATLS